MALRFRRLVALTVLTFAGWAAARGQQPKPPVFTPEEKKLAAEAVKINREGIQLYEQGQPAAAEAKLLRVLEICRQLYPPSRYPDGHFDLARIFNSLGSVLHEMGQLEQALAYYRQSLEMTRKVFPAATHPDGHIDIASSYNNVGMALSEMGQAEEALPFCQQSLAMYQKLFPASKYPSGHPQLALSWNNVGTVLSFMGQLEKALPYYQQSLEMNQRLFPASTHPDGHPHLAICFNNLGGVYEAMDQLEPALAHFRRGLEMYQRLFPAAKYPAGHPAFARSLNNLGWVLSAMGQPEKALPFCQQGLEMFQKLFPAAKYPTGHPYLARSLNNLAFALTQMGEVEKALPYCRQSLEMHQKLFPAARYPDGHPQLAGSLNNLGFVLQATGRAAAALPVLQQGLEMRQRLLRRELAAASEESAFDKINAQPLIRDAYLNVTRGLDAPAAESLRRLWPARSMATRLLEQRQANARAAGTALGAQLAHLRGLRRRTDRLLQDTAMNPADRDKQLVSVANERDALERELVEKIPALKHWQELDKLGPDDLMTALPPGAVFVDVIRYSGLEFVDRARKRTPNYAAFVVAKDGVRRVELPDAGPIDTAVRQWRAAIDRRGDAPAAVTDLIRRVWQPLAKALPPGTTTLYLALDGDLARLPWAALPVAPNRVLLEDFAVAQVPHGAFLLDQLKFGKKPAGGDAVLTLGGVDYGASAWPALRGTATEANAIAAIAPGERYAASGGEATGERLKALLPRARYVHLATHGEFKADDLAAERKRADARQLGDDTRRIAAKNPLGYVGLVLANGEVLSGLGIVDLPLQNTQLVTLSACETGLGEFTGGEGVQGLQRAFHLAGCPNVVASLWKVNDAATAALMAKFYHELWVSKKPPIEALREAQLTIYRHPELIPDLAGERGAPRLKAAAAGAASVEPSGRRGPTADTKLWAAFVLSGVGR